MEDDNGILFVDDIVKALIFNGVISGTTDVLVDAANIFGKISLKKKSKSEMEHRKHINYSGRNIRRKQQSHQM